MSIYGLPSVTETFNNLVFSSLFTSKKTKKNEKSAYNTELQIADGTAHCSRGCLSTGYTFGIASMCCAIGKKKLSTESFWD